MKKTTTTTTTTRCKNSTNYSDDCGGIPTTSMTMTGGSIVKDDKSNDVKDEEKIRKRRICDTHSMNDNSKSGIRNKTSKRLKLTTVSSSTTSTTPLTKQSLPIPSELQVFVTDYPLLENITQGIMELLQLYGPLTINQMIHNLPPVARPDQNPSQLIPTNLDNLTVTMGNTGPSTEAIPTKSSSLSSHGQQNALQASPTLANETGTLHQQLQTCTDPTNPYEIRSTGETANISTNKATTGDGMTTNVPNSACMGNDNNFNTNNHNNNNNNKERWTVQDVLEILVAIGLVQIVKEQQADENYNCNDKLNDSHNISERVQGSDQTVLSSTSKLPLQRDIHHPKQSKPVRYCMCYGVPRYDVLVDPSDIQSELYKAVREAERSHERFLKLQNALVKNENHETVQPTAQNVLEQILKEYPETTYDPVYVTAYNNCEIDMKHIIGVTNHISDISHPTDYSPDTKRPLLSSSSSSISNKKNNNKHEIKHNSNNEQISITNNKTNRAGKNITIKSASGGKKITKKRRSNNEHNDYNIIIPSTTLTHENDNEISAMDNTSTKSTTMCTTKTFTKTKTNRKNTNTKLTTTTSTTSTTTIKGKSPISKQQVIQLTNTSNNVNLSYGALTNPSSYPPTMTPVSNNAKPFHSVADRTPIVTTGASGSDGGSGGGNVLPNNDVPFLQTPSETNATQITIHTTVHGIPSKTEKSSPTITPIMNNNNNTSLQLSEPQVPLKPSTASLPKP